MNQKAVRSKLIYFSCMLGFLAVAFVCSLILFYQTSAISLCSGVEVTITGTDGTGQVVSVSNPLLEQSAKWKELAQNIEYTVTPSAYLSNGAQLTIQAFVDQDVARALQINPGDTSAAVLVEGLTETQSTIVLQVQ